MFGVEVKPKPWVQPVNAKPLQLKKAPTPHHPRASVEVWVWDS